MRETLLGFDLRHKHFLYNSENHSPWDFISVDRLLWPEYIIEDITQDIFMDLCLELHEVSHFLLSSDEVKNDAVILAVSLVCDDPQVLITLRGYPSRDAKHWNLCPHIISRDWSFLGYDVGDTSYEKISALKNCGNKGGVVEAPLTPLGLFAEVSDALHFRKYANEQIPEHKPFFVYGLYVVESSRT